MDRLNIWKLFFYIQSCLVLDMLIAHKSYILYVITVIKHNYVYNAYAYSLLNRPHIFVICGKGC